MTEGRISPWLPEQDLERLAVLGKLIEECNELSARAARCIIHGLNETDPDTGRTNAAELEREISDVVACLETLDDRLGIGYDAPRIEAKSAGFRRWHAFIKAEIARRLGAQP